MQTILEALHNQLDVRIGTARDATRMPIHRWFHCPVSFSPRLVHTILNALHLSDRHWVLDPFVGCGTTAVVAKLHGINCLGIEAHPFIYQIVRAKTYWDIDPDNLRHTADALMARIQDRLHAPETSDLSEFPELIYKCFTPSTLRALSAAREAIESCHCDARTRDLLRLALSAVLRRTSAIDACWPYVSPRVRLRSSEGDPIALLRDRLQTICDDLEMVRHHAPAAKIVLWNADARETYPIRDHSIDLIITSPPYLNNYDYAERTRLEMYFWGWARSWADITRHVRARLVVSSVTQIRFARHASMVDAALRALDPTARHALTDALRQLRRMLDDPKRRKPYDIIVGSYFADMHQVLRQMHRVLKPKSYCLMVVGDSAPYGVHIPTDELLGKLGLGVGFRHYAIYPFRERGRKWPGRANTCYVPLRESLLILEK